MTDQKDLPIIESALDLDKYKLTMLYWIWKFYRDVVVTFAFLKRTKTVPLGKIIDRVRLKEELDHLKALQFTPADVDYIRRMFLADGIKVEEEFLTFLLELKMADYDLRLEGDQCAIEITGPWPRATLYETRVISVVNQLYNSAVRIEREMNIVDLWQEGDRRLDQKFTALNAIPLPQSIPIMEFGCRRRYGRRWHHHVTRRAREEIPRHLLGTSNLWLAQELELTAMGTCAHETFMGVYGAVKGNPGIAQNSVLKSWWELFGPPYSIALTDTFTSDYFFKTFRHHAQDWKGVRQDSGDPVKFGEKTIDFYRSLGIEPKDKVIVFSDGLDVERIVQLYSHFHERIKVVFGWGTNLTNDLGPAALSLVVKLIRAAGWPAVKISDNPEKATGDPEEVEYCKRLVGYQSDRYTAETCRY